MACCCRQFERTHTHTLARSLTWRLGTQCMHTNTYKVDYFRFHIEQIKCIGSRQARKLMGFASVTNMCILWIFPNATFSFLYVMCECVVYSCRTHFYIYLQLYTMSTSKNTHTHTTQFIIYATQHLFVLLFFLFVSFATKCSRSKCDWLKR